MDKKSNLNKQQIVDHLNKKFGLTKREGKLIVDELFELMADELATHNEVKITNFGTFGVRSKGSRPGRNPKTMEPVTVTPRTVVTFHASPALKSQVE